MHGDAELQSQDREDLRGNEHIPPALAAFQSTDLRVRQADGSSHSPLAEPGADSSPAQLTPEPSLKLSTPAPSTVPCTFAGPHAGSLRGDALSGG